MYSELPRQDNCSDASASSCENLRSQPALDLGELSLVKLLLLPDSVHMSVESKGCYCGNPGELSSHCAPTYTMWTNKQAYIVAYKNIRTGTKR